MRVYYFDDSGKREANEDSPWFVVAGFGIDADDLLKMSAKVRRAASRHGLKLEYPAELKFFHVGKNGHDKVRDRRNWMLDAGLTTNAERRALAYACLRNGTLIESLRVIAVAVDTRELAEGESAMVTAVTKLLERVQMDSQGFGSGSMVMMDEENAIDDDLRDAMRSGSSLIKSFTLLHDTIGFLPSEESPGIQLADLIAGSVSRYLNTGYKDAGYLRIIWPHMRHRQGERNGYGIVTVPRAAKVPAPRPQTVPWPKFDRDVHEAELAADRDSCEWWEDGTPSRYYPAHEQVPSV
ncbi:DUF3800 domain-containing protein [Arthrobacter burdickii]|uniref:DUF3800 domain-containing protein n=1 Tax=Arthrobacter burdickii TaxID=3035920 RepID=A0ABT8K0W8_9MICC|nr:DUF3800 domain-containing protein [Arthrobacter burdickii]MDN4611078.1 DUF3800 domain-containing protein [Arthrobacter burdickii]